MHAVVVGVCSAPCRQVLPSTDIYVIGGPGVTGSRQFMLPTDRPQVVLDVQAGAQASASGETIGRPRGAAGSIP